MSDRPIIFSAPMIRALLDGRKSQTRRILKPQPGELDRPFCHADGSWHVTDSCGGHMSPLHVPYAVGDRLWCREGFSYGWPVEENHQLPECNQEHAITYRTDGNRPFGGGKWHSPIHMPRWASRLTLIVTDVRVQRLQDISEADAVAEGIEQARSGRFYNPTMSKSAAAHLGGMFYGPRPAFEVLWNSIHGPEAWAANPWCAVLSFTVHRCNIDQMPGGNHE